MEAAVDYKQYGKLDAMKDIIDSRGNDKLTKKIPRRTILKNKMGRKTDINTAKLLLKSSSKKTGIDMKLVVNKILYLLSKKGNSINSKIIKVL